MARLHAQIRVFAVFCKVDAIGVGGADCRRSRRELRKGRLFSFFRLLLPGVRCCDGLLGARCILETTRVSRGSHGKARIVPGAGREADGQRPQRRAPWLPGGSTSFHAAKGHPSRFRGSEAHLVAQRDLTRRPALLLLTWPLPMTSVKRRPCNSILHFCAFPRERRLGLARRDLAG